VPTGVGPDNVYLDIQTDYAEVSQVTVPVSTTAGAAVKARAVSRATRQQPRPELRRDVTPPHMPSRSSGLSGLSKSGY